MSMSDSWDQYAQNWESNPDVIHYSKKAYADLCRLIDLDDLRVMDFGCGTGLMTEHLMLHANSIVALDSSKKMIEVLKNKPLANVKAFAFELTQKTIDSTPELKDKFDLIVASSVCAFIDNYDEVLVLLKSLLKPNGLFVQWDWSKTPSEPDFGFDENMIQTAFSKAGFKTIKVEKTFSVEVKNGPMQVIMAVGENSPE